MITEQVRASAAATVYDCRIVDLPKVTDARGNLTFIEGGQDLPFLPVRVYYLYDVPGGASRAGHAHKALEQFLVAVNGSFSVTVKDGRREREFYLNRSYYGLYIPPGIWRSLDNFSSGSVCLSLASQHYDEDDYYRDYDQYIKEYLGVDGPA